MLPLHTPASIRYNDKMDDNTKDPQDIIAEYEAQFEAVGTPEAHVRALQELEKEGVAIAQKIVDTALYSEDQRLALKAAIYAFDQIVGKSPMRPAPSTSSIEEFNKRLGLLPSQAKPK